MAYVLGFFAADGYMTLNKRGAYFWNIQITERELLQMIKVVINSHHKISVRKGNGREKELYRLQIGSKEMFNDLQNLGFIPGKTYSMAVPSVPAKFFRDFVRGYFDGDGNVWVGYTHRNRCTRLLTLSSSFTSCSRAFLDELRCRLRLFGLISGSVYTGKGKFFRLKYSVRSSMKLYDFMYNSPHLIPSRDLFLDRKKSVFERYLKMRP